MIPNPVIFSGSKIMYMKVKHPFNITFLDSVNFLPMPLASLPKSFGLTELKKGYFPHLFNCRENQEIVLQHLPDKKFYCPDTMKIENRNIFLKWYEEHKDDVFDFQEELLNYCISDVDILRRACCEFRNLVRSVTGHQEEILDENTLEPKIVWIDAIDPFAFVTIASVCMGVFRGKFLPEEWKVLLKENMISTCSHTERECICLWRKARKLSCSEPLQVWVKNSWVDESFFSIMRKKFVKSPVASLPNCEVLGYDVYSTEALEWLHLEERKRGIDIQTALSTEGEKRVTLCVWQGKMSQYRLDGFAEVNNKKIAFEYNGCSYHGCLKCFPSERDTTMIYNKSIAQRYRDTKVKEKLLKLHGFEVISKWSCEFLEDKKKDAHLLDGIIVENNISLKDCYFGGRTNALVMHKKFDCDEKGYYYDFTSLYPAILKYKKFPIGHPIRVTKNFANLRENSRCTLECSCQGDSHISLPYFGIIKVTVLPPQDLHIPVLPMRINGKLKFPLCRKCSELESKTSCTCSSENRMFTQTYCTPELEVALNMGYKLIKIHQVLHWDNSSVYNTETKSGGLFSEYINTFLQMKQQASGFPDNVTTEKEKDEYIQNYFHHEGVKLEKDKISKNPGLRSLSKLALNSFYGKFGQRTNMTKSIFINDLSTMYMYLTDPSKNISDWHILNENMMLMEYTKKHYMDIDDCLGNVVLAAFCTSYARLKLWGEMFKIGTRVLYHDTDSIIFSAKEGEYIPSTGSYLGQFTNELVCKEVGCQGCLEGHWITEFVSCGPKNYAYKLNSGQIVCKVRGFSLNHQNSQILNFESMKQALYNWHRNEPDEIVTVSTMILRDKREPKVYNRQMSKKYGVVYDKRQVLNDLTTLPYGYKKTV